MITILCGRVAVGKSMFAALQRAKTGALVLSCDEMMLGLFDGCLGEKHDETALRCLRFLFSVAAQAGEQQTDVVLDYGFWRREERDAARAYFSERGLEHRLLLVEAPEKTRLLRLARRNEALRGAKNRVYLIEGALLARMDAKFDSPAADEAAQIYDNSADLFAFF